ncbi:MAG TPA: hypothetical protein VGI12_18120 [Vicinamibacterales bacterium]
MRRVGRTAVLALALASPAAAQQAVEPTVSVEAVGSAAMLSSYQQVSAVLDVTGTVRIAPGAIVILRPWAWHRPDGTSTFQWYQLQVRYQMRTRTPIRVDAGVITEPLGLNPLQMRADLNPTISPVPYYVIPLPRFEAHFDALQPLTVGYPLGVVVSGSGTRWDARAGVLDTTPARPGVELKHNDFPAIPQVVAGGGFTLRPGFRVGGGIAHGGYREASDTLPAGDATVGNLEAEFTLNHTRLSGEWVGDRFTGSTGTVSTQSFYLQGVQTITARTFAAGRVSHVDTPPVFLVGRSTTWTAAEFTGGVRVTPYLTVRAGYYGQRPYFAAWSNAGAVSIVLDGRWWR